MTCTGPSMFPSVRGKYEQNLIKNDNMNHYALHIFLPYNVYQCLWVF